jgi:hypothetical protein
MILLAKERPEYVQNKREFMTVWGIAHAWEGLLPEQTDKNDIPASIRAHIDIVLLAYFRDELTLRAINGLRLLGHSAWHALFFLDRGYNRLWDCFRRRKKLDIELLDSTFVMRTEILHWCIKDFRQPPACWSTPAMQQNSPPESDESDEDRTWLDKLTNQRRQKVACLEIARHLWEQNQMLSYDEVRTHPLMHQVGLGRVFSQKQFKKWANPIASESAKLGGRRSQSDS